jgi:hypothetical protein
LGWSNIRFRSLPGKEMDMFFRFNQGFMNSSRVDSVKRDIHASLQPGIPFSFIENKNPPDLFV